MLTAVIQALKSIIDLVMKGREDKKIRLEIERLARDKQDRERRIQPATFTDVQRFDPKVNLLIRTAERSARATPATCERSPQARWSPFVVGAMVLMALVALLVLLAVLN
jgi:hypothetical protein